MAGVPLSRRRAHGAAALAIGHDAPGQLAGHAMQPAIGLEAGGLQAHGDAALDNARAIIGIGALHVFARITGAIIRPFAAIGGVIGIGQLIVLALDDAA